MAFTVMTDTSANIPAAWVERFGLEAIPFNYYIEGKAHYCMDSESFDADEFYDRIRAGMIVSTSLIAPQDYIDFFEPVLKRGQDLIFVAMSSGISGSLNSARIAAEDLAEDYPDRTIEIIDTLGASLGEGLIAIRAAQYRDEGLSVQEAAEKLRYHVECMFQVFTVDDLMHLKRGGRLSNLSAIVGTVFNIKPLLKGNPEGKIVAFRKVRGRKHSIDAIAEKYDKLVVDPGSQIVGIAQAGCREEAEYLASLLRKKNPPKEILIVQYEPVTGSHVGPGALALFFEGAPGVREEV